MGKMAGLLLVVVSLIVMWILYSDSKQAELFEREGVKTQAMVTDIELIGLEGKSSSQIKTASLSYSYVVSGRKYTNRVEHNIYLKRSFLDRFTGADYPEPDLHKGDSISIEYLKSNPAVSRYAGDKKSVSDIKLLISASIAPMMIGLIMVLWPAKPPLMTLDKEEEMDWSEYERTHE